MKRVGFFSLICLGFILGSCNSGSPGAINVSAQVQSGSFGTVVNVINGNSCTNMVTGSTCTIQLTLNNNGVSGLLLTPAQIPSTPNGSTLLPAPFTNNVQLANNVRDCNTAINDSNNVQVLCNVTITYQNNIPGAPNSTNTNLVFYLGNPPSYPNAVSNTVTLSGN